MGQPTPWNRIPIAILSYFLPVVDLECRAGGGKLRGEEKEMEGIAHTRDGPAFFYLDHEGTISTRPLTMDETEEILLDIKQFLMDAAERKVMRIDHSGTEKAGGPSAN